MGFFKKDEARVNDVPLINEIRLEKNFINKKDLSLFDLDTIQYVIDNFPEMSIEIQSGLDNLADILEKTIDYIEDKSSEIIKNDRDFKLSKAYRDTSVNIYDVVQNISEYVKWMQDEYEKNIRGENEADKIRSKLIEKNEEGNSKIDNADGSNSIDNGEEFEIYRDFSLKEPKAFKVGEDTVVVEDWNDLLVKTAEVLTKKYRQNKYINKVINEIKPVEKKSTQNSFRDTVIEMLTEYKINLDEFKIITK